MFSCIIEVTNLAHVYLIIGLMVMRRVIQSKLLEGCRDVDYAQTLLNAIELFDMK